MIRQACAFRFALLSLGLLCARPAYADDTILKLSETATVMVAPDELAASMRAEAIAPTAQEAQKRVNELMTGAIAAASLIDEQGFRAQYPSFDPAASTTEKLTAMRATITQSEALLCYWAKSKGKCLETRLVQDARRRYEAKAWYLAPPLDAPGKERLNQTSEMVLRQQIADVDVDLSTLEPFLRALGWEPPINERKPN